MLKFTLAALAELAALVVVLSQNDDVITATKAALHSKVHKCKLQHLAATFKI